MVLDFNFPKQSFKKKKKNSRLLFTLKHQGINDISETSMLYPFESNYL